MECFFNHGFIGLRESYFNNEILHVHLKNFISAKFRRDDPFIRLVLKLISSKLLHENHARSRFVQRCTCNSINKEFYCYFYHVSRIQSLFEKFIDIL